MNTTCTTRLPITASLGPKSWAAALLLAFTGFIAGCGGGGGGGGGPPPATLSSISVSAADATLVAGLTDQFSATGVYSDGSKQALSSVTWTSSNTSVATVSATGLVTGVGAGTATITATSAGVAGTLSLPVTAATLVSIGVTPATTLAMVQTQTEQFTATGIYSDNSKQNLTSKVTWSSATTTVATVSAAGIVTAAGVGSSVITATLGSVSGKATVTVTAPVLESITVTPASPSVAKGLTQQFTATGNYTNNLHQDLTATVTWSSATTSAVTITSAGLATAAGVGSSKITATMGSISGSTTMTVTAAVVVSIAVTAPTNTTPLTPGIPKGTTQQFVATGTYSDTTVQTITTTAIWSSSNTAYATVSNSPGTEGLATGVGQGAATIKATLGGVSGSLLLTVNPAALVSIAVTPAIATVIAPTGTVHYTATGTYTDGSTQDVTIASTWASNNTAVAMISNAGGSNGLATGVAAGANGTNATAGITAAITFPAPVGTITSPPVTLTVKPAEFAYVANFQAGTVSQYTINPSGGALIAMTNPTVGAGTEPFAIAIDSTRHFAYVANYGGNNLTQYTIGADGSLTFNTVASTVTTGSGPNGIFVTAGNAYVANYGDGTVWQYAVNGDGTLSALNPTNITIPGGVANGTSDVAVGTNIGGTFAVVVNYSSGTVMSFTVGAGGTLTTPAVTSLTLPQGTLANPPHPDSVAIDSTGSYVYIGDQYNNVVWQLGLSNGTTTTAGTLATLSASSVATGGNPFFVDLTSTVGGTFLYVANGANSTVQQLTPGAGGLLTLTSTTSVGTGTDPGSLAVDPSGQFAYVTDRGVTGGLCTPPACSTSVSQYTIGTNGAFTLMSTATAPSGNEPVAIVTTTAY